jgi:hypothetical protein
MRAGKRVQAWTVAAVLAAGGVGAGAAAAAPPEPRRWIPPNTPGQAGTVDLRLMADPPALIGPGVNLLVEDGALSGELQGHPFSATITGDHAEGSGPAGKVSLDFTRQNDGSLAVKGVWNGKKVDLEFGPRSINGRLLQSVTPTSTGIKSCRFDIEQAGRGSTINGLSECLGYSEPVRYVIQPAQNTELTNPEVALLLIAFFSSPTSFPVR